MFETQALQDGIDGTGFDQQVAHTIGEKISFKKTFENSSHTWTKDASQPSMHLATISCACMMSPPSRQHSLPHCSTAPRRNFLATFGWTENQVTKPFTRTLQIVSSRQPTCFRATSLYCGSEMNCL